MYGGSVWMSNEIKLEKLFLVISCVIGMLLIMIEPPMTCPDENVHFYNSYALSTGQFFPKNEEGVLTHAIPKSYVEFVVQNNSKYAGNLEEKESFQTAYYNSWLSADTTEIENITYWAIDTNPIGYTFSAMGMLILRVLGSSNLNVTNLLMAGKIANLLFYVTICYWTIKLAPKYKRTFFVLALMPMAIYQGASINYDALLFPVCFFLLAYVLSILERDAPYICKRDIGIILVITLFLAGIKQIYLFLLIILFALPRSTFKTRKKYIFCVLSVIGVACFTIGLYKFGIALIGANATTESIVMHQQLEYLLGNPLKVFYLIKNSISVNWKFYIVSFVGCLGQLDTNFPVVYIAIELIGLMIVMGYDILSDYDWNKTMAALSLGGCTFIIIAMFTALYLQWTSLMQGIGTDVVDGVQGRYFIPLIPYMIVIMPKIKRKNVEAVLSKGSEMIDSATMMLGTLSAVSTALLILLRYKI